MLLANSDFIKYMHAYLFRLNPINQFLIKKYPREEDNSFLARHWQAHLFAKYILKDKMNFTGIPVEDSNGFKEFFYNSSVEELDKRVPVYYDKGYLGTTEEFIQLPDDELKKHRLGTCFGFVLNTTFGSTEFIAGKFKPNEKCLSYQFLKEYSDEEIKSNKTMFYKPKHYAKLIPVFETVDGKKVLKMLVFKTVK